MVSAPRPLGLLIRAARSRAAISVRELARRIGKSASYVSQLESGLIWRDQLPPQADLARLAAALGVTVTQLLIPPAGESATAPPTEAATAPPTEAATAPPTEAAAGDAADDAPELWVQRFLRAEYDFRVERVQFRRERERLLNLLEDAFRELGGAAVSVINVARVRALLGPEGVDDAILVPIARLEAARVPAAYRIQGDGLEDWALVDGDYLLLDTAPVERPRNNAVVVVRLGGDDHVRILRRTIIETVELHPPVPDVARPIALDRDVRIIGVCVGVWCVGPRVQFDPDMSFLPVPDLTP
jgi:transcriptional regulator with XRE-family HTH domain